MMVGNLVPALTIRREFPESESDGPDLVMHGSALPLFAMSCTIPVHRTLIPYVCGRISRHTLPTRPLCKYVTVSNEARAGGAQLHVTTSLCRRPKTGALFISAWPHSERRLCADIVLLCYG